MNAREFAETFGPHFIGKNIHTEQIGDYPGGTAKLVQLNPDPTAPEIVMMVEHPTWRSDDGDNKMGIFEYEDVRWPRR